MKRFRFHIWSTFATLVITVIYHFFLTNNGYFSMGRNFFQWISGGSWPPDPPPPPPWIRHWVVMLYFEQLLVAKVIYDVIHYMNKYLMTNVHYDVDVCNFMRFRYTFFWLTLYIAGSSLWFISGWWLPLIYVT